MAPAQSPPPRYAGEPTRLDLGAGTVFVRVHSSEYAAHAFNAAAAPTGRAGRLSGGRFDARDADPFPFLYAASDGPTAVSESLLRDIPADEHGVRIIPRRLLSGRRISWLATEVELALVTLRSGQDLAAIGQDAWLTTSPRSQYPLTREWCTALRQWAPWAQGLTWRSLREPDGFAYVLFGDRLGQRRPDDCFSALTADVPVVPPHNRLERGAGLIYTESLLDACRTVLAQPTS